jgi:hypothetical protein
VSEQFVHAQHGSCVCVAYECVLFRLLVQQMLLLTVADDCSVAIVHIIECMLSIVCCVGVLPAGRAAAMCVFCMQC